MKKQDLIKGDVSRTLIKYAWPLIFTSVFQSVYSIVDIMVVGKSVGQDGISAINNASLLLNLITQIAIGITVGGNVLISQYLGADKRSELQKSVSSLFCGSLFIGAITAIVIMLSARKLMYLLNAPSIGQATLYLRICAGALIFIFGYNALSAILRAFGNSKVTMFFIIISSIVNIVLDVIFVKKLDMGVSGAAYGTVISQLICFLMALIFTIIHGEEYHFIFNELRMYRKSFMEILKLGFPISLQWTIASISWLGVAFLLNNHGVSVSAGNGISNKIKDFCQLFISAVVSAGATMAAQNLGAGEYKRAEKIMWLCMKWNLIISAALILAVQIFGTYMVGVFTSQSEAARYALINLKIEIVAQLFYAGFMTFNILATASGDTIFVLANSFLNCIIVRLVLAFILEFMLGVIGIYLACMIAPLSSVPVGYWYYRSNKWKKVLVKRR